MHSFFQCARRKQLCLFATLLFGFAIHARAGSSLSISGQPQTNAVSGQLYDFKPTVSGRYASYARFSIADKPSWATFSSLTGELSGIPADVDAGTYSNIVITASTSRRRASLPAFSITVTAATPAPAPALAPTPTPVFGTATISWTAPALNTDGSELQNLAGFRVLYGTNPNQLDQKLELPSATLTSAEIDDLTSGTYYFAVKAYTTDAVESDVSQTVWKTVP
jgi:hypothetical protein